MTQSTEFCKATESFQLIDWHASSGKPCLVRGKRRPETALFRWRAIVAKSQCHQRVLVALVREIACQTRTVHVLGKACAFPRPHIRWARALHLGVGFYHIRTAETHQAACSSALTKEFQTDWIEAVEILTPWQSY